MKDSNLYILIRLLLRNEPNLRNSDKKLIWRVLEEQGIVKNGKLTEEDFLKAVTFESITRARRKVQENHPELQASDNVKSGRKEIQRQKGTDVYRKKVPIFDYENNTVRFE